MRVAWGLVFGAVAVANGSDGLDGDIGGFPPFGEDLLDAEDAEASPAQTNAKDSEMVAEPEYQIQPAKEAVVDQSKVFLMETFQKKEDLSTSGWVALDSTPEQKEKFKGLWEIVDDMPNWTQGEKVLKMTSSSAHHGLVKMLSKEFNPAVDSDVYGTMEVKFDESHTCGGAYFKLFHTDNVQSDDNNDSSKTSAVKSFTASTPYSIMFGPDRCGYGTNKVHLIIKFPHPSKPGDFVEEHLKNPPSVKTSTGPSATQQYGFAIHSDGTYEMFQSGEKVASGKLKEDFETKFATEEIIEDPNDSKPTDWVDERMIEDENAVKPDDWDETEPEMVEDLNAVKPEDWMDNAPQMIPNPEAVRPKDWNDEEDGVWMAPMMPNPECLVGCGEWKRPMTKNPAYKGEWVRPKIENPDYQGEWKARQIPNPEYYNIENPWEVVQATDALGFELWTVESGTTFNNILLTTDRAVFESFLKQTYNYKRSLEDGNIALYEKAQKAASKKAQDNNSKKNSKLNAAPTGVAYAIELITETFKRYTDGKSPSMLMVAFGIPLMFVALGMAKLIRRGTGSVCAPKQTAPAKHEEDSKKDKSSQKKAATQVSDKEDGEDKENTSEKTVTAKSGEEETGAEEEIPNNNDDNVNSSSTIRKRRGSSGTRRGAAAAAAAASQS